jgi:hypothetical protein
MSARTFSSIILYAIVSKEVTATAGFFVDFASAFIVETPIRIPVKDPAPITTAK